MQPLSEVIQCIGRFVRAHLDEVDTAAAFELIRTGDRAVVLSSGNHCLASLVGQPAPYGPQDILLCELDHNPKHYRTGSEQDYASPGTRRLPDSLRWGRAGSAAMWTKAVGHQRTALRTDWAGLHANQHA